MQAPSAILAIAASAILAFIVPEFPGKSLIHDLLAVAVASWAVRLIVENSRRVFTESKAIYGGNARGWRLSQAIIAGWSLIFFLLWETRWFDSSVSHFVGNSTHRYHSLLHAGLALSGTAYVMGLGQFRLWWAKLDLTPIRVAFLFYALTLILGSLLLIMPWSLQPKASISLIDALFTSVSALAVTGLSSVPFTQTFSQAGQGVVLLLIQIGGLGIVTLSAALATLVRSRLSLSQSIVGQEFYDAPSLGEINRFLLRVLAFTCVAEGIGAFWIYLSLPADLPNRAFHAVFHAVSAFCNAGFSTLPEGLNTPGMSGVQFFVSIMIILGGLGFPVIFELLDRFRKKPGRKTLSQNTILTLATYVLLFAIGGIGVFLLETVSPQSQLGFFSRFGQAWFYSVSARTAGFNALPLSEFTFASQLLIVLLMVIGGSPVSTAGGIKTTTAAVVVIAALSVIRGHKWIQFRNSEISPLILQKCLALIFLYGALVSAAILVLVAIEPLSPWALTFEVISATSTVGLSLGITEQLSPLSKLIIMGLMISGRMGLMIMVTVGVGKVVTQRFRYPTERFYVG